MGLYNLMKISFTLVTFSLAQLFFYWLRAPGQLLRSHTVILVKLKLVHVCYIELNWFNK